MILGSSLQAAAFFAILATVFLYLHREYRLIHHLLWLIAWALLAVRGVWASLGGAGSRFWSVVDLGSVVVASALILLGALSAVGTARLGRGHAMRLGAALGLASLLVFAALAGFTAPTAPIAATVVSLFAVTWIAAGWLVDRYGREFAPLGARVAGLALVGSALGWTVIWAFGRELETSATGPAEIGLGLLLCASMIILGVEEARTRYAGHRIDPAALFDEDPNMILVVQGGRVLFANRALHDRTGTREALRELTFDHIVAPEYRERLPEPTDDATEAGQSPEIEVVDREGRRVPVLVLMDEIPWRGRRAVKYEFIDVTGRRRAEEEIRHFNEELQRINAELARSNEMKTEFLSNTSHELKTPLTSIIANTEILEYEMCGPVNEEQRRVLANINRNSQHLLDMISRLLDFSRHEEGHVTLSYERVDLRTLLEGVVETTRPLSDEAELRLDVRVDERLEPCYMDGEKIYRVFLNLVENAIKFSRSGAILVEAERIDGEVEGRVADQGIGIPPDKLEEIFEAFRQVDASPTRVFQGVGLGLAICKQLVELHGGRIWAESEIGVGTRVRFRIPYHESRPGPLAPSAAVERAG